MTKIIFLMLTYNRLGYTKESIAALLANDFPFHLVIHDNGSTEPGMAEYLVDLKAQDARIVDVSVSGKNLGLPVPTNAFWDRYAGLYPFMGKVDNDTLIPDDGVERLVDTLDHCPRVAVCHGYHWREVNFPRKRLVNIDGRLLLKARWGGGCFYGIRSAVIGRCGYIGTAHGKMGGWTHYQIKLRRRGWKVVYGYPLIRVKHLGDPASGRPEENGEYSNYREEIRRLRRAPYEKDRRPRASKAV